MIDASCHCGAVKLTVPHAPTDVTDCNCTICRRYGTLWAYYSRKQVSIAGPTDAYLRGEKKLEFHRCKACGCVMYWSPVDRARDRMGVNTRMMEPAAISGARVRRLDGFDTWKFLDE
jgi:hypothetical protein